MVRCRLIQVDKTLNAFAEASGRGTPGAGLPVAARLEPGETSWLETSCGARHHLRAWRSGKEGPLLVYMHGIEGHGLWFAETASWLAGEGVTVLALDRRGAGMSPCPRGDMENWRRLLDDARELLDSICRLESRASLYLMANCWGAKVAALLAAAGSGSRLHLEGLVLSSPAISVRVDVPLSQKLVILWRWLTGNLEPLPIPLEPHHFTDNPDYLEFIKTDPLRLTHATARFFAESFFLTRKAESCAPEIELPVLVVQAGVDEIVSDSGLRAWFDRLGSKDKTLEIFEQVHHSLDFDDDPGNYRRKLLDWLLTHHSKRGSAG